MKIFKRFFGEGGEPYVVGPAPVTDIRPVMTREQAEDEKWEQRRWELAKILVAQDRRSVVLGKLQASPRNIARKARELADATVNELRRKCYDYGQRENEDSHE